MPKLNEIIGEEAFKALPEEVKTKYKEVDFVDSSNYVTKDKFNQINNEKNEYKRQIGERDKQLTDLQGKVKDNEILTKEIESLKTTNAKNAADYEKKIQEIQYETAINNALKDCKAKDINLVKSLLDRDKLKINGDEVIGLKEQLEVMQKERDYLFEKEIQGTNSFTTGGKGDGKSEGVKSLGERLAKNKVEQVKSSEEINSFFK